MHTSYFIIWELNVFSNIIFNFIDFIHFFFIVILLGEIGIRVFQVYFLTLLFFIELVLLVINFRFILGGVIRLDLLGQFFSRFIILIAACEVAVGLALIILVFRLNDLIITDQLSRLKS